MESTDSARLLGAAAKGASYLMGTQALSKLLHFALNITVARSAGPEVYGLATVELQLLVTLTLFLSHEGIRRACQRQTVQKIEPNDDLQSTYNLAVFSSLPSMAIAVGIAYLFTRRENIHDDYLMSVWIFACAAVIEVLSEPLLIVAINLLQFQLRSFCEWAAMLGRCVVVLVCVKGFGCSLKAFAWGQLTYAVVLLTAYLAHFLKQQTRPVSLVPRKVQISGSLCWVGQERQALVWSYCLTAGGKLFLSQGENLVLTAYRNPELMGVYALVSNLGSIVARLVFQPLEETAFTLFSKLGSSLSTSSGSALPTMHRVLAVLCRCLGLVSFVFLGWGPNYSWLLIHLLWGHKWSETNAPTVLSVYCLFIGFMALNGVTEAFVQATADKTQLLTTQLYLAGFSGLYICISIAFLPYGAVGLILANCLNMGLRILYSAWFIRGYFLKHSEFGLILFDFVPSQRTFVVAVFCFVVTRMSHSTLCAAWGGMAGCAGHIAVGCVCLAAYAASVFLFEKTLLRDLRSLRGKDRSE
eukprot:GILK01004849.1.p1 GENE.GILK01004849.1~~GILK01004849.1.p1  ORF type:complete len:536 (+),score=58.99 GILK01004849.1:29-1609(+)